MKEWIAKYQKAIVGTGAVAVLILCYYQQKELKRLRQYENGIEIVSPETGDPIRLQAEEILSIAEMYKAERDSIQKASDSLYNENFPCQIELGRYQVAYEIFMERNPKAAKQYGTIISEETE